MFSPIQIQNVPYHLLYLSQLKLGGGLVILPCSSSKDNSSDHVTTVSETEGSGLFEADLPRRFILIASSAWSSNNVAKGGVFEVLGLREMVAIKNKPLITTTMIGKLISIQWTWIITACMNVMPVETSCRPR
jgi:hypothetical protein